MEKKRKLKISLKVNRHAQIPPSYFVMQHLYWYKCSKLVYMIQFQFRLLMYICPSVDCQIWIFPVEKRIRFKKSKYWRKIQILPGISLRFKSFQKAARSEKSFKIYQEENWFNFNKMNSLQSFISIMRIFQYSISLENAITIKLK